MTKITTIVVKRVDYYGHVHIGLLFDKNPALLEELRGIFPEIRWSGTQILWHFPWRSDAVSLLFRHFKGRYFIEYRQFRQETSAPTPVPKKRQVSPALQLPKLDEVREKLLKQYGIYLRSKRYSDSTIKTYSEALSVFSAISTIAYWTR
jgi:integrase/recombinase XerD